jgi:hypothetical protein
MPPSGDAQTLRAHLPSTYEQNTIGRKGCSHFQRYIARRLRAFPVVAVRAADHGSPSRPGWTLAGADMSASGEPAKYEICVSGVLDSRWAAWFSGLQVSSRDEQTIISGLLADQPALHGLLTKVRDLGLCLISVRRLDTDQAELPQHDQT